MTYSSLKLRSHPIVLHGLSCCRKGSRTMPALLCWVAAQAVLIRVHGRWIAAIAQAWQVFQSIPGVPVLLVYIHHHTTSGKLFSAFLARTFSCLSFYLLCKCHNPYDMGCYLVFSTTHTDGFGQVFVLQLFIFSDDKDRFLCCNSLLLQEGKQNVGGFTENHTEGNIITYTAVPVMQLIFGEMLQWVLSTNTSKLSFDSTLKCVGVVFVALGGLITKNW